MMSEPEPIQYVSPDKHIEREALRKEKAVWEACRKNAQNLWDELLANKLLGRYTSSNVPVALIAAMQTQVLWDAPSAWSVAPKIRLGFFSRLRAAIKILWT